MRQWKTVEEVALELRMRRDQVVKLLRDGTLLGVKLSAKGARSSWRVYPPSQRFQQLQLEQEEHYLHVPLFTAQEVARVLKVKPASVRKLVQRGWLTPQPAARPKTAVLFAAAEVRRLLWRREKIHRRSRKTYSPWLAEFLKACLAKEAEPSVQQLEKLVAQLMAYLPDEDRLPLMAAFWQYLDGINEILRRLREQRALPR